jgi:ribokinase
MLDTLASYGVSDEYIRVDHDAGSGLAIILVDDEGENVIAVTPGANMCLREADIHAAADLLRRADVVLTQLEVPIEPTERALDIAREGAALCILNPAPAAPVPDRVLAKVDVLTPNQSEARLLTGLPTDTLDGAGDAGKALLAKGVGSVIITLGAQGALLFCDGDCEHVPPVEVDPVDTTGAGDAFMAGLATCLGRGFPLRESTCFANVVGALSTQKPGAMPSMPRAAEVSAFLRSLPEYDNPLATP